MASSRGRSGGSQRPGFRVVGEPAYVLHRYDWSETSLILDLFTRGHGRVAVVAKGAKRPYSQLRPVLMPFQRLLASFGSRDEDAAEVHTLRAADWAGGGAMLTGSALLTGFYLNELLMKLLARADAHPVLFDAYALTLPHLTSADEQQVQAALRAFELTLLRELGVLPELGIVTLTMEPVLPAKGYLLHGEFGVRAGRIGESAAIGGATLAALQEALDEGSLLALQQACAEALPELKSALRALLHYHLGTPVLRTRQLMMELQQK
ncbi:DNA repair protein RecO [Aquabacterium sp. A7-Y]|uniref:DNA repair protein RecO n=1 Tax=Aquabacterium sp. A7-Y TaxID=1349605 RepID=UPI00223CCF51|nr:DNA repair protein RecO [Aquabacterium sp. A7-Y]MCW7541812.1 DNA repair protein RecO [Aquabacterium sp. A7-Y]